ncbi:helix-turn-helix transcriptional regulator [Georgenia wangjunii]|uniref:helix-turn-helix transcriptional regulator n=1 Tax=Georgenia wangjunii TaxID=3117730 RepID=UPI002F26B4F8
MVPRQATTAAAQSPIRLRRRAQKVTQAELAATAGVSRQTVIAIEQGDYAPSVFLALRIARALGATVEELFGGADGTGTADAAEGTGR